MLSGEKQVTDVGGKRKAEVISVYLSKELKEGLEQWAMEDERTVSWIVAKLVQKALEEREEKSKAIT